MALVKQGSKVTCSINDLPLLDNIRNGDKFVIQTTAGTYLLDFGNFTITLDNTTFKSQFNEMWNSYDATQSQIAKIGTAPITVSNLDPSKQNLSDAVNQLNININTVSSTEATDYNTLAGFTNTLIKLLNANTASFPNLPPGISFPLAEVPLK